MWFRKNILQAGNILSGILQDALFFFETMYTPSDRHIQRRTDDLLEITGNIYTRRCDDKNIM